MYSELSDNELLELINEQKDNDAMETLIKRYGPMITGQSRSLYIIPDKGATFKTFAFMCVRRQLITAVNNSNNKKNGPLNYYISIYGDGGGDYSSPLDEIDSGVITNPEDIMMAKLRESDLIKLIDSKLSKLEKHVLDEYLTGASYEVIGERLCKPAKSIDNAVQRIRAKLRDV